MVDIVIICPLAVEFEAIHQFLENPVEIKHPILNQHFELGYISGEKHYWKVALFETGSKIENLGAITGKLIHVLQPTYIFLIGVAGGVKDVELGDVVIATKAYGYESGKETSEGFASRPDPINYSKELIAISRSFVRKRFNPPKKSSYKVFLGPIASGNKVIASRKSETYKRIITYYNDTIAVEMEAIGFATAASGYNIQFANIRGISDLLDNKAESDKKGSQKIGSINAAEFTAGLIKYLPLPSKNWPDKRFKIRYLEKKAWWISLRRPKKGEVRLNGFYIKLETENKSILLKEIKDVQHIAMKGDFARNWVSVEFREGDEWSRLFLSSVDPIGLGYWLGGSIDLLKEIKPYKRYLSVIG